MAGIGQSPTLTPHVPVALTSDTCTVQFRSPTNAHCKELRVVQPSACHSKNAVIIGEICMAEEGTKTPQMVRVQSDLMADKPRMGQFVHQSNTPSQCSALQETIERKLAHMESRLQKFEAAEHLRSGQRVQESSTAERVAALQDAVAQQLSRMEVKLQEQFSDVLRAVDLLTNHQKRLEADVVNSEALVLDHGKKVEAMLLNNLEEVKRKQGHEIEAKVSDHLAAFRSDITVGMDHCNVAQFQSKSDELARAIHEVTQLWIALKNEGEENTRSIHRLEEQHQVAMAEMQAVRNAMTARMAQMEERHRGAQEALTPVMTDWLSHVRAERQNRKCQLQEAPCSVGWDSMYPASDCGDACATPKGCQSPPEAA